ncbi:Lysophospholipase L1 [Geodermatophilus africanus]|uniref:Lysophospholipase L1 n=1 Tax=Geodermatophilus africanus TaxID=1137993 RepID=A0A1H3DL20_9ACTN|nr:GDSL-type esterase/lipase family protein [Geodermatophilus africanus]SDX66334.1 Lysophospholipase L1 [Geodermatophilus africanus]
MTVVVALGDSLTCGEGVGVRVRPEDTWVALLARALPAGRLVRLAVPGARVADVRTGQLPLVPGGADIATLLVGLNDVARSGFDAAAVGAEILETVAALRSRADDVLLGRLHDAGALLPLPARVAQATRRRIEEVNAAVDEAARSSGVRVLDLRLVPVLARPGGWSVDRVHPSPAGHHGMAAAAMEALRGAGRQPGRPIGEVVEPRGSSRRARGWWAVRHGLPYAARHVRELGGPIASAVLRRC